MRRFTTRHQPLPQQQLPAQHAAHPATHEPARAVTAQDAENEALDRAAALWTTRRIRSFFLLLEQPLRTARR